jgi:TRAP-type mannitol/chloroaromatic compound transport system permease large subunit
LAVVVVIGSSAVHFTARPRRFLVLLVIGVPVAVAVGAAGYIGALLAAPAPLATSVQTILHQVDSFVLLSLPLFILAGALMETGGIARRLVACAVALVGWIRGGLGMAVITAEYIFSGISGSTVADVSAVTATTIPGMVRAGYSKELAVAIVSAASAMGILVPPCILMIGACHHLRRHPRRHHDADRGIGARRAVRRDRRALRLPRDPLARPA